MHGEGSGGVGEWVDFSGVVVCCCHCANVQVGPCCVKSGWRIRGDDDDLLLGVKDTKLSTNKQHEGTAVINTQSLSLPSFRAALGGGGGVDDNWILFVEPQVAKP